MEGFWRNKTATPLSPPQIDVCGVLLHKGIRFLAMHINDKFDYTDNLDAHSSRLFFVCL